VHFEVIDPNGHRTGYNPLAGSESWGIQGANYSDFALDSDDDPSDSRIDLQREFVLAACCPPVAGVYRIRAVGVKQGSYRIVCMIDRDITFTKIEAQGQGYLGSISYFEFTYNSSPNVPITLNRVTPLLQVRGGIFNPEGNTLAVKAKPSVNFNPTNSLVTLTATIKWLTSYGITLGTVSSAAYGFTKVDSVITIGNYSYQKCRTVVPTTLDWIANTEYELFTVPTQGGTGTGVFELTNEIGGGEWFVDINYSDRSDTNFYQRSVSNVPLPIQLGSFRASVYLNANVLLEWMTISETNNYGFEVQRSPNAPNNFQTIPGSFIPGHGTTTEPHYYSYVDDNPGAGTWYYRLKQIDLDGTTHFTDPVFVIIAGTPIDVELESFAATTTGSGNVKLDWATRRERNNNRFELLVSANDSTHFQAIPNGRVAGNGNSQTRKTYNFRDKRARAGVWFYRLKQYDMDNRARISNAIRVQVQ
jgi:hypothetical protein